VDYVIYHSLGEGGSRGSILEDHLEWKEEGSCWAGQWHAVVVVETGLLADLALAPVTRKVKACPAFEATLSVLDSHRYR
jgi:hypothetical protein